MFRWMQRNGVDRGLCASILRMHCLPALHISVGQSECCITGRCVGVLTGTRSAAVVGRIPLLDLAKCRMESWEHLAFRVPSLNCCLGTFVDNLFSTGQGAHSAVAILEDAGTFLIQRWKPQYGQDSKVVVSSTHSLLDLEDTPGWNKVKSMRCLGHHLAGNSGISKDFHETVRGIWAAYWRNCGPGPRLASEAAQANFMRASLKSTAAL